MADRRLLGMLGIAAIVSTLVSIEIYRQEGQAPVEVAVNGFPANLPWGGYARPRFVTDLVATMDLPDIVVEYSMLKRVHPALAEPWGQVVRSGEDLAANVLLLVEVEAWLEAVRTRGLELRPKRREMAVKVNGTDAILHVVDYTEVFQAFGAGPGQLNTTDTVWAFLVDGSGNVLTYAGITDFFYDRLRMVYSLEISEPSGGESYASDTVPPELRDGKPPLDQAPAEGTVYVREVSEGDRVHIVFDLIGERMSVHEGMLQLVLVRTGLGESLLANFIGTSAGS
jgi:hypothetical protein